jgi:hypothetical protein
MASSEALSRSEPPLILVHRVNTPENTCLPLTMGRGSHFLGDARPRVSEWPGAPQIARTDAVRLNKTRERTAFPDRST